MVNDSTMVNELIWVQQLVSPCEATVGRERCLAVICWSSFSTFMDPSWLTSLSFVSKGFSKSTIYGVILTHELSQPDHRPSL